MLARTALPCPALAAAQLPTSPDEFHLPAIPDSNNTRQRDKPTTTANRPQTRRPGIACLIPSGQSRRTGIATSLSRIFIAPRRAIPAAQSHRARPDSIGRAQRRAGVSNSCHSRSSERSEPLQSSRRSLRSGRSTTHTYTHTHTRTHIHTQAPSRSHGCLARVYMIRTKERRPSPQQACSLRASIAGSACGNLQQSLSARRARA